MNKNIGRTIRNTVIISAIEGSTIFGGTIFLAHQFQQHLSYEIRKSNAELVQDKRLIGNEIKTQIKILDSSLEDASCHLHRIEELVLGPQTSGCHER